MKVENHPQPLKRELATVESEIEQVTAQLMKAPVHEMSALIRKQNELWVRKRQIKLKINNLENGKPILGSDIHYSFAKTNQPKFTSNKNQ